jgi:hypothetical protein
MDINRSEMIGDRRLRLANSSPDVKALFNSPAGPYIFNDDLQESSYLPPGPPGGAPTEYWTPTPLAPIVSFTFVIWPRNNFTHVLTRVLASPVAQDIQQKMPSNEALILFLRLSSKTS